LTSERYFDIAIDEARDRIYGSRRSVGVVDVLDLDSLDVLASVPIGSEPTGLDVSPDGAELAVALFGQGEIAFVDLETLDIEARAVPDVTDGPNRPFDVLYGRPGRLYSVGNPGSSGLDYVHVFDTATHTEVGRSAETMRAAPRLAMTADHTTLFVSQVTFSPQQIYRFDISTDTPGETARGPHGPVQVNTLAVTPDGGTVFSSRGQVWSGDLGTQSGDFTSPGEEIEYSAAHHRFFVTVGSSVVEFDATTHAPVRIHRLASAGGPVRVSGDTIYISTDLGLEVRTAGTGPADTTIDPYGEFTALTPQRVLDTRTGNGRDGVVGRLGENQSFRVQITGRGGVAPSGVAAVVMNVTVTEPTAGSYLTVWPSGENRPLVSNLNYVAGQTVPNLVTVAVGDDGRVRVFNRFGSTHVIFDVVGFYADDTGSAGSRFHPVDPYRYFDTRTGRGGVRVGPRGPNSVLRFNALGRGGVPARGVTSVVMNVTVTGPTARSFLTVYPDDVAARPLASNLNFVPGQTVPNLVTVRVPASGVIDFYNLAGNVHVLADVVGYYDDDRSSQAGRFLSFVPYRFYDSRPDNFPWGPDDWSGVGDFPGFGGIPLGEAESVVLNVTVTQPTAPSYLTVFPSDLCEIPLASNLNFVAGETVPNQVIVRLGTDGGCAAPDWLETISVYNRFGNVHVVIDVFGAFTAPTTTLLDSPRRATFSTPAANTSLG
jgi:hypothetical protein